MSLSGPHRVLVLCCALLAALGAGARASTVLEASLEQLTERCAATVRGEVCETDTLLEQGGALIWTRYRIRVTERLAGESDDELLVMVPGGRVGNLEQEVKGVAKLTVGADVVLFLWKDGDGRHQVLGQAQGVFHVERDTSTGATTCVSRLDGLALIGRDGRARAGEGESRRHSLDSLRRRVRIARDALEARQAAARRARERKREADLARAARLRELTKGKPGSAE